MDYTYKHIVVVHGIGDQAPNETVLGFMNEFIRALPRQAGRYSVVVDNLVESVDDIKRATQQTVPASPRPARSFRPAYIIFTDEKNQTSYVIGFSEVYWKQIPDEYIRRNDNNLPIPIFTWAHSINTRFLERGRLFHIAREAIDNLEKMLRLLRLLAVIYKKSGDLSKIMTKFLGDVQMYAESDEIRQEINDRFLGVLARIGKFSEETKNELLHSPDHIGIFTDFESREIYIVAHSEGTVVSFNSLVQAATIAEGPNLHSGKEFNGLIEEEGKRSTANKASGAVVWWLPRVKGLVTLGSPIDKHYTIWKNRFRQDHLLNQHEPKIPWFNYWDHSDPVGYGLKVLFQPDKPAQQKLPGNTTDAQKLFEIKYDKGFTRYFVPLLAHVDYWKDTAIYEHIIDKVMGLGTTRKETTVKSEWWASLQRPLDGVAYAVGRLAILGVIILFLAKVLTPIGDEIQARDFLSMVKIFPSAENTWLWLTVLVTQLLLIKGLWILFTRSSGIPALIFYFLRLVFVGAWVIALSLFCLTRSIGGSPPGLTDWLGYAVGFFVGCLAWSLHSTIHKGLVQMWHYTRGDETGLVS